MLLFSLTTLNLSSQGKAYFVEGTVKDDQGNFLPGVNVIEKNKKNGIITDINGYFKLKVTRPEVTLLFSYIGFISTEITATSQKPVLITMMEDIKILDDVVVVGYGLVKKSDLTGAVAVAKSDIMEDRLVLSMEDALKGRLAGVNIINTDGAPGAEMNIQIRGTSSINASNLPLYVVDGVLMESANVAPSEIESIEILKDASSTAIYGSRGANGVVIITTKRGFKGRTRINFSTNISIQQPVRLYDMMNAEEYTKYTIYGVGRGNGTRQEFYDLEGNLTWLNTSGNVYTNRYQEIKAGTYENNTDWQRAMLRNALVQEYRLNVSGGDDLTRFSILGSMLDQEGTIIESGLRRYNIRTNFDRKIGKTSSVGFNISGNTFNQQNVTGNVIATMLSQPPTKALNSDEWIPDESETANNNNNPFLIAKNVTNQVRRDNASFKGYFDYVFLKDFRLNVSGSYSLLQNKTEQYYPSDMRVSDGNKVNGKVITSITTKIDWLNENLLYYTPKASGKHAFDGIVGLTFQGVGNYTLATENNNFDYEELGVYAMGYGLVPILTTNEYTDSKLASFIARANYKYNDRYLFTASIRADGSSRLADGNKWGYFPSGAFAWRASEEEFIRQMDMFSNLKLRCSAGMTGNTGIIPYQTMALTEVSSYPMNGFDPNLGIVASRTANPLLRWETSTQYDVGIDIGFFKNRLTATIDFYHKKTKDLLLRENVPTYLGYTTRWTNRGIVTNKGVEMQIDATPVTNKTFTWKSSFNISLNRSNIDFIAESGWMILSVGAGGASDFGVLMHGHPIGTFYGYKEEGVFRSQSEIDDSPVTSFFGTDKSQIRPGYIKYIDYNGDNVVDESDRQILGYAEPTFQGGWINNLYYKEWELQMGFEYRLGGKVFNSTIMSLEGGKGNGNSTKRAAQFAYYPTLFHEDTGLLYTQGNEDIAYLRTPVGPSEPFDYTCRSKYIENGSFLRLNDVTLSYSLPKKLINKLPIQNCKFFFSVKNLFIITQYTGYDPDVNSASGSMKNLLPGLDNSAYPRNRAWTMGLNLFL